MMENLGSRLLTYGVIFLTIALSARMSAADLADGFRRPPVSSRPHTWWHWVDGNITREGITADLEAMADVGVGGAQIFNVACGVDPGPVTFMSPEWRELMGHAMAEADRVGVEICVHNCAGWSSSGGPWVKPEHAMQMVVWSEVRASAGEVGGIILPQPETREGMYRDIAVLAFPTPPAELLSARDLAPVLTWSEDGDPGTAAIDGDPSTRVGMPHPEPGHPVWLQFQFASPIMLRSLRLLPGPGYNGHRGHLQVQDGNSFRTIVSFSLPRQEATARPLSLSFPAVEGRVFRLSFDRGGRRSERVSLAEVTFLQGLRIDDWASKAAFRRGGVTVPPREGTEAASLAIPLDAVHDLSDHLGVDGALDWQPRQGDWTVLRFGYTPTGKTNHPATPAGRGLECDKMNREAMDAFYAGMMATVIDEAGDLAGRSLNNTLIDSYEVGSQNWTPGFRQAFRRRRGYNLLNWLPVVTGRVLEDVALSERFLWDWRQTIGDLFLENYFQYFGEISRRHGLQLSVEAYGNGPFDDLAVAESADIPMSEFWTRASLASHGYDSNAKEASSASHTSGGGIVGAEAFTASQENGMWQNHPYLLKAQGDAEFCSGVNRFIFHRYAHQPWLDRVPGMTMGPWGFHFERTNTWWQPGRDWLQYLSRCQFLLQSGTFVGDVLYFIGEGIPNGLARREALHPALPRGYDYDGCSSRMLMSGLTVRDGKVQGPSGATYRYLVLPERRCMTPGVLRRIGELVEAGATIVGPKPTYSPSLTDYPACDNVVEELAERIWQTCDGETVKEVSCGKGRVIWGKSFEEILAGDGVAPDFEFEDNGNSQLLYIHRRSGDADVYFISNQRHRSDVVNCTFRSASRLPELWDPLTGEMRSAAVFRVENGRTSLPLHFGPAGSVFVVFRETLPADSDPVVAVEGMSGSALALRQPRSRGALEVVRAVYGDLGQPARTVDVTDAIRGQVKDDTLAIEASNDLAGDPAYGVVKKLQVDYLLNGEPHRHTVAEGAVMALPAGGAVQFPAVQLMTTGSQIYNLRAYSGGDYTVKFASGKELRVKVPEPPETRELPGPWAVRFVDGRGAPAEVLFPELMSWTQHSHRDVAHYSGTAIYSRDLDVSERVLQDGLEVFLDLGRVEVIAEVVLNGESLGVVWKPPFRVGIGEAVKPGRNHLEVRVTNLWLNRLIGDAHIPLHMPLEPWAEVTELVREAVQDGTLRIEASNRHFGDPAPQIVKELRVEATVDGMQKTFTVRENRVLTIQAPGGDLTIHRALYGTDLDRFDQPRKGDADKQETRFTWTTRPLARAIQPDMELLPSGLLGPVRLVVTRSVTVDARLAAADRAPVAP